MIRKILTASAVLALIGFGLAQSHPIGPTTGEGQPDLVSIGEDDASVIQTVVLDIPAATALHLDTTELVFDLSNLYDGNGDVDGKLVCVTAAGDDASTPNVFWGQTQVVPGGIAYATGSWPNITVPGDLVTNYPPIRTDEAGELVPNSKRYMVCYQSFIMQLFSNWDFWDLTVTRNDLDRDQSIEHLYVQGNTCSDFGDDRGTGLYALKNDNIPVHLIPKYMNAGPTGKQVNQTGSQCDDANKSWLDMLGVLAVKVNSDHYGESFADLTYTLTSSQTQF